MSAPSRTTSSDSTDGLRKRVCKACDRCRLKKSKCDGSSPCTRCRADNAICVFGERKKSHDKVYPKGYVEMLEQQQAQLIAGLQDTYHRLQSAQIWPGDALQETEGHPLTHDILARLGILSQKPEASEDMFEEDCDRLQQRLLAQGAALVPARRGSLSSDSDHSQTHSHKRSRSKANSPARSSPAQPAFRKSFDFDMRGTTSPGVMSPASQPSRVRSTIKPSPLHTESPVKMEVEPILPIDEEILLSSWDWQNFPQLNGQQPEPQFAMPQMSSPQMSSPQQQTFSDWQGFDSNDMQFDNGLMDTFTNITPGPSANAPAATNTSRPLQLNNNNTNLEWQNVEVDFSKFVQVAAT